MSRNKAMVAGALFVAALSGAPSAAAPVYAGVAGATLLDSGAMVVGGSSPFARTETFEYVRTPDGGYVLLNTITAAKGTYRVAVRFDLDAQWNSLRAEGVGLYGGKPVTITMVRNGKQVDISVKGEEKDLAPVATCDPDCFINMSPSATSMFVMTRHYDFKRGGEQVFRWTGQDLDRERTLSGGQAKLTYRGEIAAAHPDGTALKLRHFTFVELLPGPDGKIFPLDFDLWTDEEHRPFGFRVRQPGGTSSGTVALRQGYESLGDKLFAP